jgi:hypothetical protein
MGILLATAPDVSAVERKPAQLVAQPLVVEYKVSDLVAPAGHGRNLNLERDAHQSDDRGQHD